MEYKLKNRDIAFRKLEEISSNENVSTELFLECLAHPYQFIRIEAVRRVKDFRIEKFTSFFALALNDECDYVIQEASEALGKLNTDDALNILAVAFFEDRIERPHHIADAIARFDEKGFEVLEKGTKSLSPNIRYYSARGLGSTGLDLAKPILENLEENDKEKTTFGGMVSTAARKGLKTLSRIQYGKENNT